MTTFTRAFCERKAKEAGNPGDPIIFTASTPGVKRDGRDLDIANWDLENYRANPVFLWVHDYMGQNLPIGRSEVVIEGKRMKAAVTFDQADEFARQVESKYRREFLNAVSVGWDDHVFCQKCGEELPRWSTYGLEYFRKKCPHCEAELTPETIKLTYELLDLSGVPIPGDPDALIERQIRALKELFEKRNGSPEQVDAEGEWRELAAEMADVFTAAPEDADEARLRRYQALLPKYRRMEKTPPEFRTAEELAGLGPEEIRGLFFHGEGDLIPFEQRVGAALNARNRGELEQAAEAARAAADLIQGVLARAVKEEDSGQQSADSDQQSEDSGQRAPLEGEELEMAVRLLRMKFENISGGLK